jgi:hypothetical protein
MLYFYNTWIYAAWQCAYGVRRELFSDDCSRLAHPRLADCARGTLYCGIGSTSALAAGNDVVIIANH